MTRKHSVIYTWVFSYILMLLLIIILCFSVEKLAIKKMVEEYKEITGTLQEQANESIQSYFEKMQNQAIAFCSDSTVVSYALSANPYGADYYNMILMQERLKNLMMTAEDEIGVYLYLANIGKAVTPGTVYGYDLFYNEMNHFFELDMEKYDTILSQRCSNMVLEFDSKSGGGKTVVMLTSVPIARAFSKGMFIQILDYQVLEGILEDGNVLVDSTTLIINGENQIICGSGDKEAIGKIPMIDFSAIENSEIVIDGEAYWIEWEYMKTEDWKLVTLIPMTAIVSKTDWVFRITLPVLGIALLIGICVSVGGVCVNYMPLKRLSRACSGKVQETGLKNEFERLHFAFQDMHTELESIQLLQSAQAEQLKLEFLRFCLENSIDLDESRLLKIIENLGVEVQGGSFLTAIFEVVTGDDDQVLPIGDVMDILMDIFSNQEFAGYGKCLMLTKKEMIVMLFYVEKASGEAALRSMFREKLCLLSEQYRWELIYAFSALHKGFSEMHLAYLEACELLDYKHFRMGKEIEEAEVVALPEHGRLHYSPAQEELLIRYVLAGNQKDALNLLELIYKRNFDDQRLSIPVACCLMEDIVIGMMKSFLAEGYLDSDILEKMNLTLAQLRKTSSRDAMRKLVDSLAGELTDYCGERKRRNRESGSLPIEKIMDCVEKHFREHDFNVSKAAEYLGMNMTYLSRYFKEHTGIGFLNYINGVRIDYAKQLMGSRNITVAEAARQVGFENPNTFIRLFKKFEGKTPGLFQNQDDRKRKK